MSICVADVLKLPSMRGARVLGGARGLARVVSSVSVLEYAEVNGVQRELMKNIDFVGNELAITGFMNNPDDVELQCENIQRTVDSMLRILADRLHASVVLMDSDRRVLNEAAWPRALSASVKEELLRAAFPTHATWSRHAQLNMSIYRDGIQTQDGHAMDMLIFREGEALDVVRTREAVEVVQLAVSIWSGRHDRIVVGELVRAILQDEPLKMRRLADIFHVDIASINSMWILSGAEPADRAKLAELTEAVRRETQIYSPSTIADVYDGALMVFMTGPGSMQDIRALTDALVHLLGARGVRATLTRCHALNTTTRVREAFLSH